jgi:hypothetical protein
MNDAIKKADTLIAYICAVLHGENISLTITTEMITFAQKHKVQNFLYTESKEPNLKKRFSVSVAQVMAQEYATDELTCYFEKHGLYVMPVKGICTKKRYTNPVFRTMWDIDILCKLDQAKEVHLAMRSLGYKNHVEGRKHDSYFMPPYVSIEVHRDLVDGENVFFDYYRDIWKRCKPRSGCQYIYEMSLEDEYIFNLVHLVGHFRAGGIVLRFLIDVYVYECLDMDRDYIAAELENLDLTIFYHNIRSLALYWFGTEEQKKSIQFTSTMQELGEYILSVGLYGSGQNLANLKAAQGKMRSFLRSCFPGYDSMKSMFPWLNPLLLPYAWGLRAVRAMRYRRENIKTIWNSSMSGDVESGKKLLSFYESCGLKM